MAVSSSGKIVTGLTAAALAAVGFLAFQASASAPDVPAPGKKPSASASASTEPSGKPAPGAEEEGNKPPAIPAGSGTGLRVVYSLGQDRVWLVGEDEQATRTFEVFPSSVDPAPGEYAVSSRTETVPGSDGVPIEHSVVFTTTAEGVVIGFSAAVDGSTPDPDSEQKTGGIRETREDGSAMWKFAPEGTKVVVVG